MSKAARPRQLDLFREFRGSFAPSLSDDLVDPLGPVPGAETTAVMEHRAGPGGPELLKAWRVFPAAELHCACESAQPEAARAGSR